ncbi:hypothetical protein RO3G_09423 [Rhizopus delemar RA 99-880]|uniref:Chromatin modification-related protein EAF3 n=1 Tax=Rhizopus delemar (strain RA 99-880 / ATCC MYA-4621 / FGSC 9543 / NRRL 43880) TaxID=246409 RepID=I1C8D3_RHIO9|nr:hypothetical protein RO3G_09423 [Rhizopus delemar RA 99-880]|eukprot:EIE84713.1 hypothetical protein RO3G_09423 [Rhizopus delemar RA 99-880]
MADSMHDFWSNRWHQLYRTTWKAIPFQPVRVLTTRILSKFMKDPKSIAFATATVSVFMASAFMHEYPVAALHGWSVYRRLFMGEQCIFFALHSAVILLEPVFAHTIGNKLPSKFRSSFLCRSIRGFYALMVGCVTYYYIMNGFVMTEFYRENPVKFFGPTILAKVRETPALLPYFALTKTKKYYVITALSYMKPSWDEWVTEDRVMKYTESNRQKQRQLQEMNARSKTSRSATRDPVEAKSRKRYRDSDIDRQRTDDETKKSDFKITMPESLKGILVDDWENVTKNRLILNIPGEYTVDRILDDYESQYPM